MPFIYDPYNWYWLADDGRIFSSASQSQIPASDAGYVAWLAAGYNPTIWPRDDAGVQTDRALQDVLTPFSIYCTDEFFARSELNAAIDGGFTTVLASGSMPTMSAQYNRTEINIAAIRAQIDKNYTTVWFGSDGVGYPITNAEITSKLAIGLSDHMQACYDVYAGAAAGKLKGRKVIADAFASLRDKGNDKSKPHKTKGK